MEKAPSRMYGTGVFRILTLAAALWTGCTGIEDRGNDSPPAQLDSSAGRLAGEWEFFPASAGETRRYVFGENGTFRAVYESPSDFSVDEGAYTVIDSTAHVVLQEDGAPTEEVWLRFSIRGDTMSLYKGVVLHGESASLVGEWSTVATVPDSTGALPVYAYVFTADGLMLHSYSGLVDTSAYFVDGSVIETREKNTGAVKYRLGYRIGDGRLSLYTLDTEKRLFRIRRVIAR